MQLPAKNTHYEYDRYQKFWPLLAILVVSERRTLLSCVKAFGIMNYFTKNMSSLIKVEFSLNLNEVGDSISVDTNWICLSLQLKHTTPLILMWLNIVMPSMSLHASTSTFATTSELSGIYHAFSGYRWNALRLNHLLACPVKIQIGSLCCKAWRIMFVF